MTLGLVRTIACVTLELGALGAGCVGTPSGLGVTHAPASGHAREAATITPAQAKNRLAEGNIRFAFGHTEHPRQTPDRRSELAASQHPFAVILGCADSRTGPEILFDQGLGDLFVVREAGNVIDDHALGSIEYAVEHLHARLVVVLGHERCGAIAAARETIAAHGHAEGHIESIVAAIRPAVDATVGQDAEATCKANVRNMVHALKTSEPVLRRMAENGAIAIVGAYYDLDTGEVKFLEGDR